MMGSTDAALAYLSNSVMEEAYPKPILTLAIPTYNRPDKLKDLLDSILSQYQYQLSIELVISDNSPGVETENLVAEYKKILPITYVHQPTNIGAAGNYLFTVEAAQGSYCWILGDDDLIIDGSITKLLSIIEAHPTLPAIVCGYSISPKVIDHCSEITQTTLRPFKGHLFLKTRRFMESLTAGKTHFSYRRYPVFIFPS